MNTKVKTRSGIPSLLSDDTIVETDAEKAEVINNYFSSVFTKEDLSNMPTMNKQTEATIGKLIVTEEMVSKKLKALKLSKSEGPDGFHPRILFELADVLASPLCDIFNKSISTGCVPNAWKIGEVTPIFKKGDKKLPCNYRPVSLTSVICKVMESLIRDQIVDHMVNNKLFNERQYGFVPGRSCMTQLLLVLDKWTEMLDNGYPIDIIYLDFAKAFDKVPHVRLLEKIKAYGINGEIFNWIKNFLNNRKQRVKVNGIFSNWQDILSGIPQGSVLGPILFVIYINDLPDLVDSFIHLFADDTKMFNSILNDNDVANFQDDIFNLCSWSKKWQLQFNTSKCKVMHLGSNNNKNNYQMFDKEDNTYTLSNTTLEKDLGVNIDEGLKFHDHVNITVKKANSIVGIIKRNFRNLDDTIIIQLYKTLIRPILEYGNSVWYPRFIKDDEKIERVQRRVTKLIKGLNGLSYQDRLRQIHLPTLKYRRMRGDMIEVYKFLHGYYTLDSSMLFSKLSESSTRGHSLKLYKNGFNKGLDIRKYSFSYRIVDNWNSLTEEIVTAPSINCFKNRLDKFWDKFKYVDFHACAPNFNLKSTERVHTDN